MTGIPDGVTAVVDDIIARHRKLDGAALGAGAFMRTFIAEAIMDEREACASIAEQYAKYGKTESDRTLCEEIAVNIRYGRITWESNE